MEWGVMTSFPTHLSLKEMERENSFFRCVLYYFGTFCKRNFVFSWDFLTVLTQSVVKQLIALELASYPNNLNSSNGFSSHLSLIPS